MTTDAEMPVCAKALRKAYDDRAVVDGIDLSVAPGEILGFVGPNGAGKSTCLRMLVGLIRRDGGSVTVFGRDPGRDSLAVRRTCSYLPGETSVYRNMRARDFLEFALKFYPRRRDQLVARMVDRFELPLRKPVRAFSAGMKQKLALLAAFGPDVPLYILDEPDRALDTGARLVLRDLMLELKNAGASILLSSHHLSEIGAVCDRTTFALEGRTVNETRITTAKQRLRRLLRLSVDGDLDLPAGLEIQRLPGGTLEIYCDDPVALLADIPRDRIRSAELGATRLEDIYQELTK